MSPAGAGGRENPGMSSDNSDENSERRKPEVSYATFIDVGIVGPKPKLKSEGDG